MENNIPKHVAIILDGNRRYAHRIGLPVFRGHEIGFDKIKELLEWCIEIGVKELTLYCFSTENFKREKKEIDFLFSLFRNKIDSFRDDKLVNEKKVRIRIIGRISMFPKDMLGKMEEVMEKTKNYDKFTLNLAMAYGSRAEIADAFKKILRKGVKEEEVNEELISKNLYLPDDVDLLIRPGGEKRLSNYLLWQMAYGEIIWTDKMWPELGKEDFLKCIEEFGNRERRFGK